MVTPLRPLVLLLAYSILPFAFLKFSAGPGWHWKQIGSATMPPRGLAGAFRPAVSPRSLKIFTQRESQFFEQD